MKKILAALLASVDIVLLAVIVKPLVTKDKTGDTEPSASISVDAPDGTPRVIALVRLWGGMLWYA